MFDRIDCRFDEDGLVANDLRFNIPRQTRRDLFQTLLHLVSGRDRVLAGLFRYHQRDGRNTIQSR